MNTRNLATLVTLLASGCAVDAGSATDGGDMDNSVESADLDAVVARRCDNNNQLANNVPVRDASGAFTTVSSHGSIDLNNEFFQDLGTNGRRCVSCHVPTVGWTITPHQLQATFEETDGGKFDDGLGLSAVFRTNDGANSPKADVSTKAKRRAAYSMLLDKGLVRVGLAVPANAEFDLIAVDDPYKFASAAELSLFRRPLPTTNLKFDSTVMWDGRESGPGQADAAELLTQASDAVIGHAQGSALSAAQRQSIADFELSLASAQVRDDQAGDLSDDGAKGGPSAILAQPVWVGLNDNFGDSKTGAAFNQNVFTLFQLDQREDPEGLQPDHRGAPRHRAWPGAVQRQEDRDHGRVGHQRRGRVRQAGDADGLVLELPRHPQRRPPLGRRPAQHRPGRCLAPHQGHAALHAAQQDHGRDRPGDRPGPRDGRRQVEPHRPLQGPDAPQPRPPRPFLPQPLRGGPVGGCELLQRPLPHWLPPAGEV